MEKSGSFLGALKKYTMLIALVAVAIFFYFATNGTTLKPQNFNNLIAQNAYVFVLATGMLLCILTGGNIDLAVGSVVCFAGGIGAVMMDKNIPWYVATIVMIVIGILVGMWQGYWIAYVNVPPFIATLAGMLAFRGLANIVMGGYQYTVEDETFLKIFGGGSECYVPDFLKNEGTVRSLGRIMNGLGVHFRDAQGNVVPLSESTFNITCLIVGLLVAIGFIVFTIVNRIHLKKNGYNLDSIVTVVIKTVLISGTVIWISYMLASYQGIPSALIWVVLVLGVFAYVTKKTTLGRNLYAVGGSEKATRLSGINTKRVMFLAYTLMGTLAGFTGVLNIARYVGAQPTYGQGYEMDAIAACFIGGASAYGGTGTIGGVIIGAALMGVINQGMVIMGTSPNMQVVVKGLVLLIAVFFDVFSKMFKKGGVKA